MGELLKIYQRHEVPSPIEIMQMFPHSETWYRQHMEKPQTQAQTPQEREMMQFYGKPAHGETILAHLTRLTMHKHLKGDDTQKAFLLSDYSKRLHEKSATELQIFDAVEHFIENDSGEFFPTYAKLSRHIFGKVSKEDDQYGSPA